MYLPSDDTFFIADKLSNYHGNSVLEIGTGSGYLCKILCQNFKFVVATDIDLPSINYAKTFLKELKNKNLVCCNLCCPIRFMFDMIICNPPYLPIDIDYPDDNTIYGGRSGLELTFKVLQLSKSNLKDDGRILIVKSSLTEDKEFNEFLINNSLTMKILSEKRLFFEILKLVEISKIN